MASIKVIAAGWEVELEIPDDEQVMHALRYQTMLSITAETVQTTANDSAIDRDERANKLTALAALQVAIDAARDAALPILQISEVI